MNSPSSGGTIVTPYVRDFSVLGRQLTDWLADRLDGAADLRLENFDYPRGAGQSHETILFEAHWREAGENRSTGLAVRIKPTRFTVFLDDMFEEQCQLMQALKADGRVPVAGVYWLEKDPSILGAPFFVMERLHGRVAVSHPSYMESGWVAEATAEQRARLWGQAVRMLGALQTVPQDSLGFLVPAEGMSGFEYEWDRWDRFLRHIEKPDRPVAEHRRIWSLLRDRMPADPPAGLVWGDARIGNILVDDSFDIVALMDWEQPSLGGALQDLGWWLFNQRVKVRENGGRLLAGIPDREETIEIWAATTGIEPREVEWYEAFAGLKTASLSINMMDMRGQVPPGGDYAATPQMRCLQEFLRDG